MKLRSLVVAFGLLLSAATSVVAETPLLRGDVGIDYSCSAMVERFQFSDRATTTNQDAGSIGFVIEWRTKSGEGVDYNRYPNMIPIHEETKAMIENYQERYDHQFWEVMVLQIAESILADYESVDSVYVGLWVPSKGDLPIRQPSITLTREGGCPLSR